MARYDHKDLKKPSFPWPRAAVYGNRGTERERVIAAKTVKGQDLARTMRGEWKTFDSYDNGMSG